MCRRVLAGSINLITTIGCSRCPVDLISFEARFVSREILSVHAEFTFYFQATLEKLANQSAYLKTEAIVTIEFSLNALTFRILWLLDRLFV